MKAKSVIRLKFPSKKHQQIAFNALKPETNRSTTTRSKTSLQRDGTFLILETEAQDTVALRATLNAYLRWITSIANVLSVLEKE